MFISDVLNAFVHFMMLIELLLHGSYCSSQEDYQGTKQTVPLTSWHLYSMGADLEEKSESINKLTTK